MVFSLSYSVPEIYGNTTKNVDEQHLDEVLIGNTIEEIDPLTHIEWKKGDKSVYYKTPQDWGFQNNNMLDYGFTRVWNHTMEDHLAQKFTDIPHNWWTGVEVYRIGSIDTIEGTFDAEFNYWVQIFEDNDPTQFSVKQPETNFVDFVNMIEEPEMFELTKGIIQKKHYHEVSVSGTFQNEMNFKKWPFENLKLKIIIEPNYAKYDSGFQSNSIQFHIWPYPIFVEGTQIPGYEVVGYDVNVEDYQYSEGDEYSRYMAVIDIQRQFVSSFLKYFFPICVMAALSILVMYFPRGEYMTKIELNAIFLLGILFFVQVVAEEVPETGGITIFDILVMMSYAVIIVTILTPARKWKDQREFEKDVEDYEWWENKHKEKIEKKRNTLESTISYLRIAELLANNKTQIDRLKTEREKLENDLKNLELYDKKIKEKDNEEMIRNEFSEFSITGDERHLEDNFKGRDSWIKLIQEFNDEKKSKKLEGTNRNYNRQAYIAIGCIIVVGVVLMMALTG